MSGSEKQYIIDAVWELLETQSWDDLSLDEIATKSETPLPKFQNICPDKAHLLDLYFSSLRHDILDDYSLDQDETIRERLFDVMMEFMDEINTHSHLIKPNLRKILREPRALCIASRSLLDMSYQVLKAVNVNTSLPFGPLRIKVLSAMTILVLRKWLSDDTEDMSKTMAYLDQQLAKAESWEAQLQQTPFSSARS